MARRLQHLFQRTVAVREFADMQQGVSQPVVDVQFFVQAALQLHAGDQGPAKWENNVFRIGYEFTTTDYFLRCI